MDTYEKKYKEALEKIKNLIDKDHNDINVDDVLNIFPELAESKDESIRKELIIFLEELSKLGKNTNFDRWKTSDCANWITWLEKQGEKSPSIIWHNINEEPEEMKELFCEWESDDATWHDVAFYDEESKTFRHNKMHINVTKWVYVDELLEKQVDSPIKWNKNTEENKPQVNHSVLMKTAHGIAEGEWKGEYWLQYRWVGMVKDSDILSWMELSDLEKQDEHGHAKLPEENDIDEEYKIGKWFTGLIPCWINAPSTLQPAHSKHGKNVVAIHLKGGGYRCCCIDDKKPITFEVAENTPFVEGWHNRESSTWSEEDEHRVKDTIYFLDTAKKHYASTEELDACIDWLKSLKQRIGG